MGYRRDCIGAVSGSIYENLTNKWNEEARNKKQASKGGGDYYNNQIVYLGDKYLEIAFNAYYKNKSSDTQLADYLNVKIDNPGYHFSKKSFKW